MRDKSCTNLHIFHSFTSLVRFAFSLRIPSILDVRSNNTITCKDFMLLFYLCLFYSCLSKTCKGKSAIASAICFIALPPDCLNEESSSNYLWRLLTKEKSRKISTIYQEILSGANEEIHIGVLI